MGRREEILRIEPLVREALGEISPLGTTPREKRSAGGRLGSMLGAGVVNLPNLISQKKTRP
jgi:hypothetical protein